MAVRQIRIYGDPCLRDHSDEIADPEDVRDLVADMAETMYASNGIGLAAPQVGVNRRLFIMDTDWADRDGGSPSGRRNLRVFINPRIVWESAEDSSLSEGCLSLPEIEGEVFRPQRVRMAWQDEDGAAHEEDLDAVSARCVQHELDHLDGKLFIDRMSFVKRQMLAGKLRALKRRAAREAVAAGKE